MLTQIQQHDLALRREIAERRRAEAELEYVHQQLVDASRAAGMAEVATDVLHNVGNVLNSVNVSAIIMSEKLQNARATKLVRAAQLLNERDGALTTFLVDDPKGRLLPGYLVEATEELAREQTEALKELELLSRNIERIKEIVAMQQSYAKTTGVTGAMPLNDLIEDALQMNAAAFERHGVTIVRDYALADVTSTKCCRSS